MSNSRGLGTARVLLCAAALLANATLVPLLHAQHGGAVSLEQALGFASRAPQAAGPGQIAAAEHGGRPAHEAAACPLCATLAQARAAIAAPAIEVGGASIAAPAPAPRAESKSAAPDLTRGAPRAPPALVS